MSIKSKILSLINAGNETTGLEDNNLTDVVQNLIDGYGTGSQIVLGQKTITANGTYSAIDDEYNGYSQVVVNVSQDSATLTTKTITNNGTYNASSDDADGYSQVTVTVPASAVDSGTKSITANGNNQDVVGYAAVNVNVPNTYSAGDEGKVVSNGALVAQTSDTVTTNDTYDTTLINSLTVNVSGGGLPTGLTYMEVTPTVNATSSNKLGVQLPIMTRYSITVIASEIPTPDSTLYWAISWTRANWDPGTPGGSPGNQNNGTVIRRPNGEFGADQNMGSYDKVTGILSLGGSYGTFKAGLMYRIYIVNLDP